jgi:hypothetical protein
MPIHPDFKDLLAVFAIHKVDYLVVGGYAVGFHARPRFTKDIDLWVGNQPDNLVRVQAALEAFGAPAAMLAQIESALDQDVLWMGVPPVRIDIVKGVPGGNFSGCYSRRVLATWDGVVVSLISRDDLIVIKRASGRPQDLLDVETLEAMPDGTVER